MNLRTILHRLRPASRHRTANESGLPDVGGAGRWTARRWRWVAVAATVVVVVAGVAVAVVSRGGDHEGPECLDETFLPCLAQSVELSLPVSGTPVTLTYSSDRHRLAADSDRMREWLDQVGLGGWTLDIVHWLDLDRGVLHRGDGSSRSVKPIELTSGEHRDHLAVADDTGEVHLFDRQGVHVATVDSLDGRIIRSLRYEGGMLRELTGRGSLSIDRVASGETIIETSDGRRTHLEINDAGHLVRFTDTAGATSTVEVTPSGLVTGFTLPDGGSYSYRYDDQLRLIEERDPLGVISHWRRDKMDSGYSVVRTEGSGAETRWAVQTDGDRLTATRTSPDRLPARETATRERHTMSGPDGTELDLRLAPDPRWDWQVPVLAEAMIGLGASGRLTLRSSMEVTGGDGDPFAAESIRESWDIGGDRYTQVWDRGDRELTATSPEGRVERVRLDEAGQVVSHTSGGQERELSYDAGGWLSAVQWGGEGPRISFDYGDRRIQVNGPAGSLHSWEFDDALRTTRTQVSSAGHAQVERLDGGAVSAVTLEGGTEGKLGYDSDGRIQSFALGGQPLWTWQYDQHGRFAGYQDGNGSEVTVTYDDASRRDQVSTGSDVLTHRWDESTGLLAAIDGETVQLSYEYQGPFLVRESWSGTVDGTVTRTLDDRLRVSEVAVNDSRLPIAYDRDGLVSQVGPARIERDSQSGAIRRVKSGNLVEVRDYDRLGLLSTVEVRAGDRLIYQLALTRDDLGRVTRRREQVGEDAPRTTTMTYDDTGQLTEVAADGTVTERYRYDELGNRVRATTSGEPLGIGYDSAGRIIAEGESRYEYDAAGRLATRSDPQGTIQFDYDALGLLQEVRHEDGRTVRYQHDGQGRRVATVPDGEPGSSLLYLDAQRPAGMVSADGAVTSFGYADDTLAPLTMATGPVSYRIITDDTGSPRLVVDVETGEVAQRIDYDAFGQVRSDTSPGFQPFAFSGGILEPVSGLVRFGHRDYDPSSGRWAAADPILYAGGDANLYRYVHNDPINFTDPTGLDWRELRRLWRKVTCLRLALGLFLNPPPIDYACPPDPIEIPAPPEAPGGPRPGPGPGPRKGPRSLPGEPWKKRPWAYRGPRSRGLIPLVCIHPLECVAEFHQSFTVPMANALADWLNSLDFSLPGSDEEGADGNRAREPLFRCGGLERQYTFDECMSRREGSSTMYGDPHVRTIDGVRIRFMAAGEFVYVDSPGVVVQTRFKGELGRWTGMSAVAIGSGDHVVEVIYDEVNAGSVGDAVSLRIDGEPQLVEGVTEIGEVTIATKRDDGVERVYVETADGWLINVENLEPSQNITAVPPERPGETRGIIGTPNGDRSDDLVTRDGTVLPLSTLETVRELYGSYAGQWRVREEERLFTDTAAGMWTTAEMTALPDIVLSLGDLPPEDVRAARRVCLDAGVPAGPELEDCTFDVAVTQDESWAQQQAASDTTQRFDDRSGDQREADDPLFVAAHRCRMDELTALLDQGADVSIRRAEDGWTALMFASQHDCPEIVAALLDAGADPTTPGYEGFFPLYLAAQNGRTAVVRHLLDRGAVMEQALPSGDTPLLIATFNGHAEVVSELIRRGVDPNIAREDGATPVMAAATEGNLALLRSLIAAGADVNRSTFERLSTPLHFAADGELDVVAALLEAGADINRQDERGNTPLHYAANAGAADIVRLLLGAGADPDVRNGRDQTPRDVADDSVRHLLPG